MIIHVTWEIGRKMTKDTCFKKRKVLYAHITRERIIPRTFDFILLFSRQASALVLHPMN